MILGDRIRTRLTAIGKTQADLAREIKVTPQAISKMVVGGTTDTAKLWQIARFLRTTPEYLTGESEDPDEGTAVTDARISFRGAEAMPDPDAVEIQEFDLAYGMGASFIHDVPVTGKLRTFSRAWLRQFTDSPVEALFWATGIGDSMMPTIQDADVVLVDTAQRTPRVWDKLWTLEMGGMGMIKRLRPTKDGDGMRLLSDGGMPEEVAYDGEMQVIGRVVAIVRKV